MSALRLFALAVCLLVHTAGLLHGESEPDIIGRVVRIKDGDSFTVLDADKREIAIRLEGIAAPVKKQPYGDKAKGELSALIFDREVVVKFQKLYFNKVIGHVTCGGLDVNLEMVRRGLAWRYDKYDKGKRYLDAQAEAKAAGRGLWAEKAPVSPWEWQTKKKPAK